MTLAADHVRGGAGSPTPLAAARRAVGLSRDELATALFVSRTTVTMWDGGIRGVPRHRRYALALALGLEVDDLDGLLQGQRPARHDGLRLPALAAARRASGFTQRKLAALLGVAPTTLSMWETAGVRVPARAVPEIARILCTPVDQLTADPPPPEPETRPLRGLRRDAHMSCREAAAHLGIHVGTLARYESGARAVPAPVLRKMALIYRRTPAELLRLSGTSRRHRRP